MFDSDLVDAAFRCVAEGVERQDLPSGVLALATSDETVRVESFGPVATDGIFLLASVTKPIFSTAVMRLVEQGRVRLNDQIASVIPEFAVRGKGDVRLWHLLTHTSGLNDDGHEPYFGKVDRAGLIAAAVGLGLTFRTGSRYAYVNSSFFVMADLIRRLTGQDDVTYLHEQVLAPFGMVDTGYAPSAGPRVVPVHNPPWPPDAGDQWNALAHPAGGLWSTAADLVRFGQAFLKGGTLDGHRVLAPATIGAMTSVQTTGLSEWRLTGDWPSHYGLGFGKAGPHGGGGPSAELRTPNGFGHGGATGTLLWIEPEIDLIFVFLTNQWAIDQPYAARALNAAIAAASACQG